MGTDASFCHTQAYRKCCFGAHRVRGAGVLGGRCPGGRGGHKESGQVLRARLGCEQEAKGGAWDQTLRSPQDILRNVAEKQQSEVSSEEKQE